MNKLLLLFLTCLTISCTYFTKKDDDTSILLAKVHDNYLYLKDVKHVLTNSTDSAAILKQYIDGWVKRQLLFYEADEKAELDRDELERRVAEYRYQLLVYAYQKQYTDNNLDTVVTNEQIKHYYDEHIQNFELKQHIVRCIYGKFSKDSPKKEEIKNALKTDNQADREKFKSYCYLYAKDKKVKDTVWIPFEEAIAHTPFAAIENPIQFLKGTKSKLQEDDEFWYALQLIDYKIADQVSPIAYVKEQIVATILNQRKIILQQQHEDGILAKAKKTEDYEVFYPTITN